MTMTSHQIKKLESLLDKTIIAERVTRLTAPGDNYGSLMLKLDITLAEKEVLHLVAKVVPPNERTRVHFNSEKTFRTEIAFYKDVVPLLQSFQTGVDFFPKYYGSRLNLNNGDSVDSDGVLLLENVKMAGYTNLERTRGFDLDVARLVIGDLARFHSGFLALRLRKTEIFDEKVRPYLLPWRVDEDFHNRTKKRIDKIIDNLPQILPLKNKILTAFDNKLVPSEPRELFATVVHNDFWVNNVMVKFDGTKPIKTKMVDFQEYTYASPAKDVVFFLFSSVRSEVLEQYYEELIQYYYDIFVSTLKRLECDVSKFSYEAFEEELALEAQKSQFAHLLFMLWPIFTPRESAKEESTPDDLLDVAPSFLHLQRLVFIVGEFARRKWI